jgi:beta-hydroxyacyl-ACP dehydratase FabZ
LNWLAHFVLSPSDDRARLGGWLADVLTPSEAASVSDPMIRAGIRLHREVDRLTDAHPAVLESRLCLPQGVRRYAGIVLDVAWDHFLSIRFRERVGRDLEGFVHEVHVGLLRQRPNLSTEVAAVVDRMVSESWLTCYRDTAGYELTLRRIPHRYPFLLVDRCENYNPSTSITGIKCVTYNEPFFQGHFPFRSVMPGVLIMEAMAQAGAAMASLSSNGVPADKTLFLAGANDFRWKRPVVPGDLLRVEMTFTKKRPPVWKMVGLATVDGQVVAQGELTASEVVQSAVT